MQVMSRQRFPWRLMRLMLLLTLLPALVISLGLLIPDKALASTSASHISDSRQVIVNAAVKHDVSPPLSSITPVHTAETEQSMAPQRPLPQIQQGAPNGLQDNVQNTSSSVAPPLPSNSFDGVGNGFSGPQGTFDAPYVPPDTNGAVGPQDYVQTVNAHFAIFNKDTSRGAVGSVRYGPVQINTVWSGFGGLCEADNNGDPIVMYDTIANRWIISQLAFKNADPNYYDCIAVSTGSDPTGTYNRYAFAYADFPDFPKFGLWPDAYYVTFNLFDANDKFAGAEVCAYDRVRMLNGSNATQQCFITNNTFSSLLPASLDGLTLPPISSPNYLMALTTSTALGLWKFQVNWNNPTSSTFTGPTNIPVAAYAQACGGGICIPQSETSKQLFAMSDRLMYRLAYRNLGGHESLVVNHAVTSGSSVGIRWYEIRVPGPTLFQSGTYAPDTRYRWLGSIAQDKRGDMAMGFSISGSAVHPGISYTGRLASDPKGLMAQGETSLIVGEGSQNGARWGDYSSMTVDPNDDCTFWYTSEYIRADGRWKTHIGSFKFPSCR